jgi:hypothetical protein
MRVKEASGKLRSTVSKIEAAMIITEIKEI